MNSRWYDPALDRFTQPDTIVPISQGTQAWDRHAYSLNNPTNYTDPTGHYSCSDMPWEECENKTTQQILEEYYGIAFTEAATSGVAWVAEEISAVYQGVTAVARALTRAVGGGSVSMTFKAVFGQMRFTRSTKETDYWGRFEGITDGIAQIGFYDGAKDWGTLVPHELGHAFNKRVEIGGGTTPYHTLHFDGMWADDGEQVAGYRQDYVVQGTGYTCNGQCYDDEGNPIDANHYYRTYRGTDFHHSNYQTSNEDFADTFANWATNSFTMDNKYGRARADFMTTNMSEWVSAASGR